MKAIITILIILSSGINGNLYSQWSPCYDIWGTSSVYSFIVDGNNVFVGTYSGVYLSYNNGLNWTQTTLNDQYVLSLAINGSNIFAGTQNNGIFISTNSGVKWTQTSLNNQTINALAIKGTYILAGTGTSQNGSVYISNDMGASWTPRGTWSNQDVHALTASGNYIYAGIGSSNPSSAGVYLSLNNGSTWMPIFTGKIVLSFAVNGNNIFAGTQGTQNFILGGVYHSTNNGVNWTQTDLNNYNDYSVAISGNNIFAGSDSGFYFSTNNGSNWLQRNEGFPGYFPILSLCVINNYVLAGTHANGVWRRFTPELVGLKNPSSNLPGKFELYQNYPNPFNPSTNIKYELPKSGFVKLTIYDVLGNEIAVLLNENQTAGTYELQWNAANFPSGVYLYKISANEYSDTKRMVLVK